MTSEASQPTSIGTEPATAAPNPTPAASADPAAPTGSSGPDPIVLLVLLLGALGIGAVAFVLGRSRRSPAP